MTDGISWAVRYPGRMRLATSLATDHAPRLLSRFLEIIGPEPWLKRYRVLLEQARLNPLLRDVVARRHSVELTIGRFLDTRPLDLSLGLDVTAPGDYAALSFIAPVAMIYESLTPVGKARMAGILRDGLNRELRPFQNEVETVTHLANVGFDIAFPDLEGESGFDFLATRDGAELEVECRSHREKGTLSMAIRHTLINARKGSGSRASRTACAGGPPVRERLAWRSPMLGDRKSVTESKPECYWIVSSLRRALGYRVRTSTSSALAQRRVATAAKASWAT